MVELATRLIVEEALEGEVRDALDRGYYARGDAPGRGHRNGHRTHRLKSAEGGLEDSAPQVAGLAQPFRSALRDHLKGHTEALESLAVEVLARGLSVRDIEDAFKDETGRLLLSRTAVAEIGKQLWEDYQAFKSRDLAEPSRKIARELADGVVADYGTELANAVGCFMDDFEACIAHLRLPITHRRATRTTNLLERLFVEERRRLKIIPNAFGEKAVLKLMFGAMTRAAERWRSIRISEFERRQMAALRQELDHDYEAAVGLDTTRSKPAPATKIPSRSRT